MCPCPVWPAAVAGKYCSATNYTQIYASQYQPTATLWVQVRLIQAFADISRILLW